METALLDLAIRSYSADHPAHRHDFAQLVLPLFGELLVDVGGREGRLTAGRAAVVARGSSHTQAARDANSSLILDIAPDWLEGDEAARLLDEPFHAVPAAAMKLVDYMALTVNQGEVTPESRQFWAALFLEALVQPRPEPATRLASVLRAVERHPGHPWTTSQMAAQAAVSPSRLHALFRREMNSTPQQWLATLRLKQACELLQGTTLPIIEIAYRCGYSDQSAFTRAFVRAHDQTPSAYRKAEQVLRSLSTKRNRSGKDGNP